MKKKLLIKPEKSQHNVVKPLCNSNTTGGLLGNGGCCLINWGTGDETDVLL
jgi:hypothetical protein